MCYFPRFFLKVIQQILLQDFCCLGCLSGRIQLERANLKHGRKEGGSFVKLMHTNSLYLIIFGEGGKDLKRCCGQDTCK